MNLRRTALSIALMAGILGIGVATSPELIARQNPDELSTRAEAGDKDAQRELGEAYLEGKGLPRDTARGLLLLESAADQDDPLAHFALYTHYAGPGGTFGNQERKRQHLRRAAALGHTTAMALLAQTYLARSTDKALTKEDQDKAKEIGLDLLTRAAEAKNPHAAHLLADYHRRGLHVPKDTLRAIEYLEAAGDASAHWQLAAIYQDESTGRDDPVKAMHHLHQAGNRKHAAAILELVSRYEGGRGVPQDLLVAKQWADYAVKARAPGAGEALRRIQGQIDSARILASETDTPAPAPSPATTVAAREPAVRPAPIPAPAPAVVAAAQPRTTLEPAAPSPRGVAQEVELNEGALSFSAAPSLEELTRQMAALERRNQALDKQVTELNEKLKATEARLVATSGERDRAMSVVRKLEEALAALRGAAPGPSRTTAPEEPVRIAAPTVSPDALNRQALAAFQRKDYAAAMKHFDQAAAQGSAAAMNNLAMLHMRGHGTPVDVAKAIEHFERAAKAGSGAAAANIAYLYHYGKGVAIDHARALTWYRRAKELGVTQAQRQIDALSTSVDTLAAVAHSG